MGKIKIGGGMPTDCIVVECIFKFLRYMVTPAASNLGTLLSGIGTVGLMIMAVTTFWKGTVIIGRWLMEKRLEKKSNIAEDCLNQLEILVDDAKQWLKMYSFVFDGNKDEYKAFAADKYALSNYSKEGQSIRDQSIKVQNHMKRLSDRQLDGEMNDLVYIINKAVPKLHILYFVNATKEQCIEATEILDSASDKIVQKCELIRNVLIQYINYHQ